MEEKILHKAITKLKFFRYNSTVNSGPYDVAWFKLALVDSHETGVGLTYDELQAFLNYAVQNETNFHGSKNRFDCTEGDGIRSNVYSSKEQQFPRYIILKRTPEIYPNNDKFECVEAILTTESGYDEHTYNLEFDIIGEIIHPNKIIS